MSYIPRIMLSQFDHLGVQKAIDRLRQAATQAITAAQGTVQVSGGDTTPGFLSAKLVAGTNILLTILNPGGDEQIRIDAAAGTANAIVWYATKTWAEVYAEIQAAGGAAIVLVPNDGPKEMTPDPGGPTDLSNVEFVGIGRPTIDIDSAGVGGFELGGNRNLQSKDIDWIYYYQIATGNATWTFDGGSLTPGVDSPAASALTFALVLRNGAIIDATPVSTGVIVGITLGCSVGMLTGAYITGNIFASAKFIAPFPGCYVTLDASSTFNGNLNGPGNWIHAPQTRLDKAELITYDDLAVSPQLGDLVSLALDSIKSWLGKSLVSGADPPNTRDYLSAKLAAGAGVLFQILNPGVNEQLEVASAGKARVSAADPLTMQDFLSSKLVAGAGILLQILNPGVNEQLQVSLGAVGGSGFTPEGGLYVTAINDTGAVSVKGALCHPSAAIDSAMSLIPVGENDGVGVVYDAGVAPGQPMRVVVGGWADVLIAAGQTIQREWWVGSNPGPGGVPGQAITQAVAPATTDHFKEIGHCFQTLGVVGVPTLGRCLLHFN